MVTALNESNTPQTIVVSILARQNISPPCTQPEYGKFAFLCGEPVTNGGDPATCDPLSDPNCPPPPPIITPPSTLIFTPLTVSIPAQSTLVVYGVPPTAWYPPSPIYEVRVQWPPGPARLVIVNAFGVNASGVPQEGNTVLHHQWPPSPARIL